MLSYTPDVTVALETEAGPALVHLAEGGEQFPWAVHKGKVILGPPGDAFTDDGLPFDALQWEVSPFWVIDAVGADGSTVNLTPDEYRTAIRMACE